MLFDLVDAAAHVRGNGYILCFDLAEQVLAQVLRRCARSATTKRALQGNTARFLGAHWGYGCCKCGAALDYCLGLLTRCLLDRLLRLHWNILLGVFVENVEGL